ncbi:MAG TPA: gephyrin-like molybdotransferase Glp [Solirubrobacteraceae bacterium]|jgi:molybdopterin molybdotransferase|nr:gephyrin-like molybdotransferase Glp [Solirubrobacteraceae bacterium]
MAAGLIELEQARGLVLACAGALSSEPVALPEALGRVLAEDVHSDAAVPPFDNSAMDGFAVRSLDVSGARAERPVLLTVVGESRAGSPTTRVLARGEAIAISTGAVIPDGADAVVPVERTQRESGRVEVRAAPTGRANVRFAGEDVHAGELVLGAGSELGAAELGVLASLGRARPLCVRRPRLAVMTTGDELVELGRPLGDGKIYNSNSYSISALARLSGAELVESPSQTPFSPVADDHEATRLAIAAALERADVLVLCGGVSVGEHDHVRGALADLEVRERFWGVALKPGKPTLFATHGDKLVFGLPGNPASAFVTFCLFVAPALRALSGAAQPLSRTTATLLSDCPGSEGRADAVRCRLRLGARGWEAEPTGPQGSHLLTSMLGADALAILPADCSGMPAGGSVEIEMLPGVGTPAAGVRG